MTSEAKIEEQFEQGPSALGTRLRGLRRRQGLTLADVADQLGVSRAAVCQWEAGKSYPLRKYLPNLANALGTSVSYLLVGQVDETSIDARTARVIRRARKQVAAALGVDLSRVKIEIDVVPGDALK